MSHTLYIQEPDDQYGLVFNYLTKVVVDVVHYMGTQGFEAPEVSYDAFYLSFTFEDENAAFAMKMRFNTLTREQVDRERQRQAGIRADLVAAMTSVSPTQLPVFAGTKTAPIGPSIHGPNFAPRGNTTVPGGSI